MAGYPAADPSPVRQGLRKNVRKGLRKHEAAATLQQPCERLSAPRHIVSVCVRRKVLVKVLEKVFLTAFVKAFVSAVLISLIIKPPRFAIFEIWEKFENFEKVF